MKKDKPFTKRGAFAGTDYRIEYYPDDECMDKSVAINLQCLKLKFRIDMSASDVKRTRKFIKALKKGLKRLER